jgi:hypothetical protein
MDVLYSTQGEMKLLTQFYMEHQKEGNHLGGLGIEGLIILK